MRQDDFVNFMRATICKFEQGNSYGTAHIYKNSLSNLIAFYRTDRIPFKKITPELLKGFEFYLRQKQLSWNTVSTYLRQPRPRAQDLLDQPQLLVRGGRRARPEPCVLRARLPCPLHGLG